MKFLSLSPQKKIIQSFADEMGLVYFGYVSQRTDEHHIVRGMTVSTKHHDDHYCIGSYEGYDVVFVERSDTLKNGKKHTWHILEFDLKAAIDLPHVFIGSKKHGHGFDELRTTKFSTLLEHRLGHTSPYPSAFEQSFSSYVTPAHAVAFEQIVTPDVAGHIASYFQGLVIELTDQALYVYSEKAVLSESLLTTMLKNGVWLAAQIDKNSR